MEIANTKRLDHLPILMAYLRKMKVMELIDDACPKDVRAKVSHGQCVAVILCGVFVGEHSLWRVADRLRAYDMATIMQDPEFNFDYFHDDRLGAALDAMYLAGLDEMMTRLAVGIIDFFAIQTRYLRFDTTAFALHGDYETEDGFARIADVATPPEIVRGYSKDHRPDLKQVMFGMVVSDDGGIPLMGSMLSGNTADSRAAADFFSRIRDVVKDPREVVCVADCKSWCLPVLARCQEDELRLLSRLPRQEKLHAMMLAKTDPVQSVEFSGEICELVGANVEECGEVAIELADGTSIQRLIKVPARAVRIYSPNLHKTKRIALKRRCEKERRDQDRVQPGYIGDTSSRALR
jgi:transposase